MQLEAEVRLCSQIQAELRRELSLVECQLETSKANLREAVIRAEEAESRSAGALEEARCARESAGKWYNVIQYSPLQHCFSKFV